MQFFPDRSQIDSLIFQSGQAANSKVFNNLPNSPLLNNQLPNHLLFNNQLPSRSLLSKQFRSTLPHSNLHSPFRLSLYLWLLLILLNKLSAIPATLMGPRH
jgi:hypothetical protein